MNSPAVLLILRVLHIGAGVFWVGSVVFFARFMLPTAAALGQAAAPVMSHLMQVRKVPQVMMGSGLVTILAGAGLYWHDSMGFQGPWMQSNTAMGFGTGAVLAILALLIGLTINRPTAARMAALMGEIQARGGPPTPEQAATMKALQTKLGNALRVAAVLLVLATIAMAVARYLN